MRARLAIGVSACGWLQGETTSEGSVLEPGGGDPLSGELGSVWAGPPLFLFCQEPLLTTEALAQLTLRSGSLCLYQVG